ncbi:MAG: DUF447 domain-containing protein [Nitrososphaerales archaeon]
MNALFDLGLVKDRIFETIVSTYDSNGEPNAAPMGVMTDGLQRLMITPYITTQTYRNLVLHRCAVVNITSEPVIYYATSFKEDDPDKRAFLNLFEKADLINAPRLRNADAYIEVKVRQIGVKKDRAKVLCGVEKVYPVAKIPPKAYCRAPFAVIESIIHATKIKVFLSNGEKERTEELINLVKHYGVLVRKTAPDSVYTNIMEDILKRIEAWTKAKKRFT